ncbi:protein kinase [Bradyrhizobium sp. CCGB01]|nr:protein kinase [Bradyrhizobium sp. CCGB01]
MAGQQIKSGLLILDRFELVRQLGAGVSGSVWLARDSSTGSEVVLKFFARQTAVRDEYYRHLLELHEELAGIPSPSWITPIEVSEFEGLGLIVLPYFEGSKNLADLLAERPSITSLRAAFSWIAGIANALDRLHQAGVVHADIKPSNILISSDENEIRLIDFGMIRRDERSNVVELISTWRYLHPIFTDGISQKKIGRKTQNNADQKKSRAMAVFGRTVPGAYVDIYALGIIALELLTGQTNYARPPTERSIKDKIGALNGAFARQSESLKTRISNLILQLVLVSPENETISARAAASIAESIVSELARRDLTQDASAVASEGAISQAVDTASNAPTAVFELRNIRASLEEETLALYSQGNTRASLSSVEPNAEIQEKVSEVFSTARRRTQSAWRIGMAMTVICFSLIVAMIVIAVVMSTIAGKFMWGAIFGSLGVSSVIGTLIWRPYDRLFRATILAQQIEVIHIKVVAGLRSVDRGEQLKVCEDAIESLTVIFKEHALGERGSPKRKVSRKKL